MMRLDKYLSERLGIPRGESRKLAAKGRVTVNGVLTKKADTQIEEATAEVAVDGRPLAGAYQKYVYLMLNKPEGVVSAAQDKRDHRGGSGKRCVPPPTAIPRRAAGQNQHRLCAADG